MKKAKFATILLLASLGLAACTPDTPKNEDSSSETSQSQSADTTATSESDTTSEGTINIADASNASAEIPSEGTLYMRQLYAAPHGTKSVGLVNVVMNGETIVHATLDEFQYLDASSYTGAPSSDGAFGETYPTDTVLASKVVNNEAYSALMAENDGATQSWQESVDAITDFAKGKTITELETAVGELDALGEEDSPADVVSGATFSDTKGYLQAIVDTAKEGTISVGAESNATDVKVGQLYSAPHGDKSFGVTTVAVEGDKVVAVFLDEFQYLDPAVFGGLPNSDADFGEGVGDGLVLASKIANDADYSALMAERGGSTQNYATNMQAIEAFTIGKTISELEDALKELDALGEDDSPADVVSGATFSDTQGYLQAMVDAAKAAK